MAVAFAEAKQFFEGVLQIFERADVGGSFSLSICFPEEIDGSHSPKIFGIAHKAPRKDL